MCPIDVVQCVESVYSSHYSLFSHIAGTHGQLCVCSTDRPTSVSTTSTVTKYVALHNSVCRPLATAFPTPTSKLASSHTRSY